MRFAVFAVSCAGAWSVKVRAPLVPTAAVTVHVLTPVASVLPVVVHAEVTALPLVTLK